MTLVCRLPSNRQSRTWVDSAELYRHPLYTICGEMHCKEFPIRSKAVVVLHDAFHLHILTFCNVVFLLLHLATCAFTNVYSVSFGPSAQTVIERHVFGGNGHLTSGTHNSSQSHSTISVRALVYTLPSLNIIVAPLTIAMSFVWYSMFPLC